LSEMADLEDFNQIGTAQWLIRKSWLLNIRSQVGNITPWLAITGGQSSDPIESTWAG
jgi:hypothetical protein